MRMGWIVLSVAWAWTTSARAQELTLEDVMASVVEHHPRVERELARRASAQGELEAARGAFDPRAVLRGGTYPTGYYENHRVDLSVEAQTPFYGLAASAGYRLGSGYFASYDGRAETLDRGELRVGVRMPLLADLAIDAPRAGRRRAELDVALSDLQVRSTTLELCRLAAAAYFRWVAAGRSLDVSERMLELAERRDVQLGRLAAAGSIAPIEARENERAVLQRRARRTMAEQRFAQAAVQLSLYLRDRTGAPTVVLDRSSVPESTEVDPEPPPPLEELLARALERRPDVASFRLQLDRADVSAELARNGRLPRLDAQLNVSRDLGGGSADQRTRLGGAVLEAGLTLSAPIPNRTGTGRSAARAADVEALDAELAFALEQIAAQVREARLAVEYTAEAVELERQSFVVADELARAEWRRFEEGATSLLLVTLREQTATDAELAFVERSVELDLARAQLELALGEPAVRSP